MPNIINVKLPPAIEQAINKNMCFLSMEQIGIVGELFTIDVDGSQKYFKIVDIWYGPKDFAIKFLWRMCGAESKEQLEKELNNGDYQNVSHIFAHMYRQVEWDKIQNLVI